MTTGNSEFESVLCAVCTTRVSHGNAMPLDLVHGPVRELIRKKHADLPADGYICFEDLNQFRSQYVEDVLEEEKGALSTLEAEVVRSFREQELLAENTDAEFDRQLTTGEWIADHVAEFGGSWTFIVCFGIVMLAWILLNTVLLLARPFDPYPFILLNLVLSCLAAMQAPVIMMSQNRQEAKDRMRAEHDYQVNLKAELEIRHLNAKIDMLLTRQWRPLLELQQFQADLIQDAIRRRDVGSQ
jgi:uncharacterized membrane protein